MGKTIIVAIDEHENASFNKILEALDPSLCMVKIGSVSFNSLGHNIIHSTAKKGFDIFLDLKLHDIPNTVKKSIEGLTNLPIKMLTVHISGGRLMMESAMQSLKGTDIKVFGVTTLTSLSDSDTNKIYRRTATEQVNAMLDMAEEAKIDGVVCSPHELDLVTARGSLLSITPGIRLLDSDDDQTRVMTPKEAIDLGSNFLVIGRPITGAQDISKALNLIYQSIN